MDPPTPVNSQELPSRGPSLSAEVGPAPERLLLRCQAGARIVLSHLKPQTSVKRMAIKLSPRFGAVPGSVCPQVCAG